MTQGATDERLTPDELRDVLATATWLPRAWVIASVVVATLAALDVTRPEGGGVRWHVSVGTASLISVALIWLPTALRLLTLAGGSVKAGGMEAATSGLLNSDELIEHLARVRAKTAMLPQTEPENQSTVRSVEADVDQIAQQILPAEDALSTVVLERIARSYEDIRRNRPPGRQRTIDMNTLVSEVRIRSKAAPDVARQKADGLLKSAQQGDRIVGLALSEGSPEASRLDDLLRVFSSSESAFEQYHALVAIREVAPNLSDDDRRQALTVLEHEKSDPRAVGLMNDPYIPSWIDAVISLLRGNHADRP